MSVREVFVERGVDEHRRDRVWPPTGADLAARQRQYVSDERGLISSESRTASPALPDARLVSRRKGAVWRRQRQYGGLRYQSTRRSRGARQAREAPIPPPAVEPGQPESTVPRTTARARRPRHSRPPRARPLRAARHDRSRGPPRRSPDRLPRRQADVPSKPLCSHPRLSPTPEGQRRGSGIAELVAGPKGAVITARERLGLDRRCDAERVEGVHAGLIASLAS